MHIVAYFYEWDISAEKMTVFRINMKAEKTVQREYESRKSKVL